MRSTLLTTFQMCSTVLLTISTADLSNFSSGMTDENVGVKSHAFWSEPDFPSAWCVLVYPTRCPQSVPLCEATPKLPLFPTGSLLRACHCRVAQAVLADMHVVSAWLPHWAMSFHPKPIFVHLVISNAQSRPGTYLTQCSWVFLGE